MRFVIFLVIWSLALAAFVANSVARADGIDGLYAERSIKIDEIVVRRVHDPHNGVVCYVASSRASATGYVIGSANLPAISCVRY